MSTPEWIPVRQDGKFLLEYDPQNGRVRLRRWGQEFVIELKNIAAAFCDNEGDVVRPERCSEN
jgi:hypothetical protein